MGCGERGLVSPPVFLIGGRGTLDLDLNSEENCDLFICSAKLR